jgi:hypothetical protein
VSSDAPDGGKFDEHPRNGQPRKEGHSASSLVATDLGIEKLPEVRMVLRHVTNEDLNGGAGFMDLAACVKLLYNKLDELEVVRWATVALRARLDEQKELFGENMKKFDREVVAEVISHQGTQLRIGAIVTDDDQAGKISRMRGFGLLIQMNSSGHVQIFPNKKSGVDMRDVVRLLRLEELKFANDLRSYDWVDLESENSVGCPVWYIHPGGGLVMNGSKTHTDIPATKIPPKRILELVLLALDDKSEHKECQICIVNPRGGASMGCPFYSAGFLHCREVRQKQDSEGQAAVA